MRDHSSKHLNRVGWVFTGLAAFFLVIGAPLEAIFGCIVMGQVNWVGRLVLDGVKQEIEK